MWIVFFDDDEVKEVSFLPVSVPVMKGVISGYFGLIHQDGVGPSFLGGGEEGWYGEGFQRLKR